MRESWVPDGVDTSQASPARMYDYYLGGAHNFEADRDAAQRAMDGMPFTAVGARVNRAWLGRAVRFLAQSGVRQFLDLGSGVPTAGNVHEIAQRHVPEARVVYVDIDPVATAHASRILAANPRTRAVHADMTDVSTVIAAAGELLDWSQPVAVLASAVFHFVPDDVDPVGVLGAYRAHLVPGSYLALSHMSPVGRPNEELARFSEVYQSTAQPVVLRDRSAVEALLRGFSPADPGLVRVPLWRPDDEPSTADADFPGYAAVGRKAT